MVPAELEFLKPLPLFAGIPEKAREKVIEKVRKYLHVVTYQPGELVLRQGEYGDSAFYVVNGVAEVVLEKDAGAQAPPRCAAGRHVPSGAGRGGPGGQRDHARPRRNGGDGHPLGVPGRDRGRRTHPPREGRALRRDVGPVALPDLRERARGDAAPAPPDPPARPPHAPGLVEGVQGQPRHALQGAHPRPAPEERRALREGRRALHREDQEEGRARVLRSRPDHRRGRARPRTPSSSCAAATSR